MSQADAMTFRPLAEDQNADRWIPQILPWVVEAGDPYYSWFFRGIGLGGRPDSVLASWMRRRSSEVSVRRAVLLVTGDCAAGGFIALAGLDLQGCRRADTLAALQVAGREGRTLVAERIQQGRELFAPVAKDELYLSKLWVASSYRRAGHGDRLLREYVRTGMAQGFRRFRLDVWAQNRPAVELYLSAGFAVLRESSNEWAGMTYVHMALEVPEGDEVAPIEQGPGATL
jgi:ribosomal protein S18 acetylase RimI-like enzyme